MTLSPDHPAPDIEQGIVSHECNNNTSRRTSAVDTTTTSSSTSSLDDVAVEVEVEVVVVVVKVERECRICQVGVDGTTHPENNGYPIELGCCCKEDLGFAHKHCAETWFKIRGNKTCEICGSIAQNVVGLNEGELTEQWNDGNDNTSTTAVIPPHSAETRHFWQGHKFLNFLLACMVFAFVISWLFHFNVPS